MKVGCYRIKKKETMKSVNFWKNGKRVDVDAKAKSVGALCGAAVIALDAGFAYASGDCPCARSQRGWYSQDVHSER